MQSDGKKGSGKGRPTKKSMPLSQRMARAIVFAIEGKGKPETGQAAARPKYDPPPLPKGRPQRRTAEGGGVSAASRGGVEMPKGSPGRRGQQPKGAPSRQPKRTDGKPIMSTRRQEPPQRQTNRRLTAEEKRFHAARRARAIRAKRRKKRIIRFSAVSAALLIFLILSLTVLFKIENIIVVPAAGIVYDESQIKNACGIEYGVVNLFRCKLSDVEERLEKTLPYIGAAEVRRSFPSSLKVTAEPTVAAAAVDCGNGYLLTDKDGKMLQFTQSQPKAIAVLKSSGEFTIKTGEYIKFSDTSEGQTDDELLLYKEIIGAIKNTKIADITLIDIRDKQSVKLMYQNRLTLYLGTGTMIETKLKTAVKTLSVEDDGSKTKTGSIDLSTIGVAFVNDTERESESASEGQNS